MKKATLVIFLFSISLNFSSCSNNNDGNHSNNGNCINPPNWLIGTWIHYNEDIEEIKYIISENNIIEFYDGIISSDYKELYCEKESQGLITEQAFEEDYYSFKWISTYGKITVSYDFQFFKVDSNTMNFRNSSEDETKTFEKQ